MSDPTEPNELALAERVRTGLAAVVEAAGDPPALEGRVPPPAPSGARRWLGAAAAVAMLVGVAVVARSMAGSGGDGGQHLTADRTTVTQAVTADRPLLDTRWALVAAEHDGRAVETQEQEPIGLRFLTAKPTMHASDACNGISRGYQVDGDEVVLGEQVGGVTLMACGGPLVDVLREVLGGSAVQYRIDGDRLELRTDGVDAVLAYRAVDGIFAPTTGTVVDHGEVDGAQYRLLWRDGGLSFEVGDESTEMWAGGGGLGDDPGRINADRRPLRGRDYVYGIVPKDAVRVVYEPMGGAPQELEVHQVGSTTSAVVGTFVDRGAAEWMLTAYDADDIELFRYRFGPSQDDKNGLWIENLISEAGFQGCCRQVGSRYAFTDDGVAMSAGSSPLVAWAPRDPTTGLADGAVREAPGGGTIAIGRVRDEVAVRFDCWLRYEVRAAPEHEAQVIEAARALSQAQGCPVLSVG